MQPESSPVNPEVGKAGEAMCADREESPPNSRPEWRRAALGFLLGAILVAAAVLVIEEVASAPSSGSRPSPSASSIAPVAAAPVADQHRADPLPEEVARHVARLTEAIRNHGDDLASRRELARTLLDAQQFVSAYRQAEELEAVSAGDLDALYVKSVVRLRMGQNQLALDGLQRLLAERPDDVDGLRVLGLVLLRIGDPDGAVRAWERGLIAAQGRNEELARLLAVSRAARQDKAAG